MGHSNWGGAARPLMLSLGAVALIGAVAPTQARAADNAKPDVVQEVVVTATRREIAAEKVGVSLTVVGAQDLKVLAPKRLEDLAGIAPNVFIGAEVGAPNQGLIYIRGQGYSDVEMDQAPPVGVLVDGVASGSSTGQLASLFDVCSVEVDSGPQGIFYGKNTSAGLINISRCAPTRRYGGEISLGGGSFGDGFARGVFNAPIGDKGGFKLTGQWHTNDGYLKDVFDGKHVGGDHSYALHAVVNYDVASWLNANLSLDHMDEKGGGNPVQYGGPDTAAIVGVNSTTDPKYNPKTGSPIGLTPWQVATRPGAVGDTFHQDVVSLILKANTPLGQAVSQTAFVNQADKDNQDYDGTCLGYPGCTTGGDLLIASGALPLEVLRGQTFKQFTQEERLAGSIGQFDYLVGAYFFHEDFTLHQITNLEVVEYNQQSSQRSNSWSEFGNLDWNPTSTIKLSAGVRNISETKDAGTSVDYYGGAFNGVSALTAPRLDFNHTWSHVITRFNAQWQVVPEALLYASRSEGFRSGGFSVRGNVSEGAPGQTNYAPGANFISFLPETNVTYEVGMKTHAFDNALLFNIDGFINDITNFQQTSVVSTAYPPTFTTQYASGTNTYVINLPKVEIKGVELQFTAKVGRWVPSLEGLTVSAVAGFQNGRITNGKVNGQEVAANAAGTGGAAGTTADFTGDSLYRLPSDNYTIRGTYVHGLGEGKLTTTIGYSYVDKYVLAVFTPTTPDVQPAYGLLDVSATYNWKDYYVKVSGKNLTNVAYRQFSLPTVFIQSYAPPASFGVEFGAKF